MQSHVQDDHIRRFVGRRLKLQSHPAVTLNGLLVVDGRYGIRKCKKLLRRVLVSFQTFFHETILMIEHIDEAWLADISTLLFLTVYRIAEIFVIGTHSLGNGATCTARPEEMTNYFLSRAYLGKSAVNLRIQVYSQGLLARRKYDVFEFQLIVPIVAQK